MRRGDYPSLVIRFTIQGNTHEVSALIDTGFDGYVVVPTHWVTMFPPPVGRRRLVTASGEVVPVPTSPATIELMDVPGPFDGMAVALVDEFLLGLRSINHM